MTTRETTGLLARSEPSDSNLAPSSRERLFRMAFAAVQWPWLIRSLGGGSATQRQALLARLQLPGDALPNLGSWKADAFFLHRIVDEIERIRPAVVVELGSGASSLVIARALAMHGGGRLTSFDQHRAFVDAMGGWLDEYGLTADFHHAPLRSRSAHWPGLWYALPHVPPSIDLLVIDGPPWAVHPFARGMAESLFNQLSENGTIMLDDAARPGERIVAHRWRRRWPAIRFTFEDGGAKGLLLGRRGDAGSDFRQSEAP